MAKTRPYDREMCESECKRLRNIAKKELSEYTDIEWSGNIKYPDEDIIEELTDICRSNGDAFIVFYMYDVLMLRFSYCATPARMIVLAYKIGVLERANMEGVPKSAVEFFNQNSLQEFSSHFRMPKYANKKKRIMDLCHNTEAERSDSVVTVPDIIADPCNS